MNVRTLIVVNRGLKWKIDGRLYEQEMYVPEIVRDRKVNSYEQQRGIMIVTTKDQTRIWWSKGVYMNKRICKKVYKRADKKTSDFIEQNKDKRSTFEVAKEEHILSALEKDVFLKEQERRIKLVNEIITELIEEERDY